MYPARTAIPETGREDGVLLSFLFYIPVAVFAGLLPILGMLMLPKTICYILMFIAFYKATVRKKR